MSDTVYDGGHRGEAEYELTAEGVRLTGMTGKIPMFLSEPRENSVLREHTHSWYELFYVSSGRLFCRIGEESFFLGAGEMLFIPPGKVHYTRSGEGGAERYVFNFSCRFLRESQTAKKLSSFLQEDDHRRFRATEEERRAACLLYQALQEKKSTLAATYLFELLLCAAETVSEGTTSVQGLLSDSSIGRIYKLEQIFNSYYMSNVSLAKLAAELHISVRQLSRIIQKQYGCSYRQKITAMRMDAAYHLLQCGNSVSETAERVGYTSFSCFGAAFQKAYGCLPSAVRKKKTAEGEREKEAGAFLAVEK